MLKNAEVELTSEYSMLCHARAWLLERIPESWSMALGGFVLGSLILYLNPKGPRDLIIGYLGYG